MVHALVTIFCLVAFVAAFFFPFWAWVPIGLADGYLLYVLGGAKRMKWKYIPELSRAANEMLQRYGHFYTMPFAGTDFSSSASGLQIAGIAVDVVCAFKGFWWGLGLAVLNYLVMGPVSVSFNPTHFLKDPSKKNAHDEVIAHIRNHHDVGAGEKRADQGR